MPRCASFRPEHVNLAYQNIDSAEIGISDIDHYYEYLGGVSKSVERIAGTRPGVMVGDSTGLGGRQRISSLEKMVSLEARTKLLNPKWYDAMLEQGYEGVREIEAHLGNTYGWSATASAVQNWTYRQFNETYLQDKEMLERLRKLNPYATISMTRRLLEANSRGFWEPTKARWKSSGNFTQIWNRALKASGLLNRKEIDSERQPNQ